MQRKGTDVYTICKCASFITAALGGEAKVQTLNGQVMCRIPEGTQSGCKIRLKGKGIQAMGKAGVYGDLYVTVQVQVPRNLSEESKRKLREFDTSTRVTGSKKFTDSLQIKEHKRIALKKQLASMSKVNAAE
ncbi:MAG: DnaJ C-terminal domain-containing protein [Ruminococcus sp.]